MTMTGKPKIEPSPWAPTTEEGKRRLKEFNASTDSAFDEQIAMMNIKWTKDPPTKKELVKTTHQDKDDRYVR